MTNHFAILAALALTACGGNYTDTEINGTPDAVESSDGGTADAGPEGPKCPDGGTLPASGFPDLRCLDLRH